MAKAWKSPLIEEQNARVVDLLQRSGCLVLARRAAHPLPVVITTGPGIHQAQSPEGGTSIWGMTVCGLLNPLCRPSGPLGLYYAPSNRGLRPRQRIYQPSGLRTAGRGSPAEIRLFGFSPEGGTSIWGMTVCGLLNPVCRPSGPLALYYAPSYRGLRPRQRIYQPSGPITARSGSPVEIRLPQRQIEIGLERFLWGVVRTVGVDFKAG